MEKLQQDAELMSKIESIWKDILSLKSIEKDDSFLQIGGNSINAINIIGRMEEEMGIRIEQKALFVQGKNTLQDIFDIVKKESLLTN